MAGEDVVTKLTRPEFTNSEIALSTKAVCCSADLLFPPCARNEILLWSNGTVIKRWVGGIVQLKDQLVRVLKCSRAVYL